MLENNEENDKEEIKQEKIENKTEDTNQEPKKNETAKELKNEASKTVNQVKDTIKNTNIKEDSIEAKNFVKEMFSKPTLKIKEVVEDTTQKTLKYAIIILVVWTVVVLSKTLFFSGVMSMPGGTAILSIIKTLIQPALIILLMSAIILMLSKQNKKSLTTIISTITIAHIPVVISSIITYLNYLGGEVIRITSPISSFCSLISIVLTYFAVKFLLDKDDDEAIKSFALVEIIYLAVAFVLTFLGIYI